MAKVPVVKATNLVKEFKLGAVDVVALESVNLEIYSGEFIIFFGPSGCGKSTLMSMLAGLQPPSKGKVLIRGEDLGAMNDDQLAQHRRTKIGMVFQSFNLITSMNILENIALPLTFDRIPRDRRLQRAENLLETVGMSEYKQHTPSELSGGQQQRIALARSLVTNPWIILADEPTGNLDSKAADDVMRLLIKLNRKSKRTVILITHNPDYLIYADRIFHMKDGKVIDVEVNKDVKMDVVKTTDSSKKIKKIIAPKDSGESEKPVKIDEVRDDITDKASLDSTEIGGDLVEEDADLLGDSLDNKKDTKDKKSNLKSKMKVMKLGK
ncbi:MAG: ABC transporter ATP-binding protein [Patescibacteria group bacterium]|nr:ABC transporter ATP-binding protein [Patescibacteria group bacterium]